MTFTPPETRARLILRLQNAADVFAWDGLAEDWDRGVLTKRFVQKIVLSVVRLWNEKDTESTTVIQPTELRKLFTPRTRQIAFFSTCCILVAVVSVYDAVLVVLNDQMMSQVEQNPLGHFLIHLQGGDIWLFFWVKLAGTAVVVATLITLYERRQRVAEVAAVGLAVFQIGLLAYLTFA